MAVKRSLVLFTFILAAIHLKAQFSDSFADTNFTANPTWSGQDTNFIVDTSSFQLRLMAPSVTATSYLSTSSSAIENAVWEFYIKMDFNPSGANLAQVYLVSDQADLAATLNGYFVMVGNTSDEISLYRQDGNSTTEIIDGTDDKLDISAPELQVRVTRDSLGNWELFSDTSASGNYVSEGTVQDNQHLVSAYFGVFCDYTSTRSDRFYFDDFVVTGGPVTDKIPPELDSLEVVSANQLRLFFNEPMETTSAETVTNYSVNGGIGNPSGALQNTGMQNIVDLQFATSFQNGQQYQITATNVEDTAGNALSSASKSFLYYIPATVQYQDILINEFMADPTPPVGLPDKEFVELWNFSNKTFNLENWLIGDENSLEAMPEYFLAPFEFLIVCSNSDTADFSVYGNVVGVSSLPAFNNGGDQIRLRSNTGVRIDSIAYTSAWYQDPQKEPGGYSLERIAPNDPCKTVEENFRGSDSPDGGTPGNLNSVFDTVPGSTRPVIASLAINGVDSIVIGFSKKMDSLSLENGTYQLPGFSIDAHITNTVDLNEVTLVINPGLTKGVSHELSISGLADCYGLALEDTVISFGLGRRPQQFEVVIHEFYPDPDATVSPDLPEYEFVELYNTTDDILSLNGLQLSDASTSAVLREYNLLPKEYVILCEQGAGFEFLPFGQVLQLSAWPSLNNFGDNLELRNSDGSLIHRVFYADEWYGDESKGDGGYTLEMIDALNPCAGASNWRASNAAIGGTPGMENSVKATNRDQLPPALVRADALDSSKVLVEVDEVFDSLTIAGVQAGISPQLSIDSILYYDPLRIVLRLTEPMQTRTLYTLDLSGIGDCAGNTLTGGTAEFGLPELPEAGDIVINELLSNPRRSSGTDYVELYNQSEKFISIQHWSLANWDDNDDTLGTVRAITDIPFSVAPGGFVVFNESNTEVIEEYPNAVEGNLFGMESLPSFPNAEGSVIVLDDTGGTIDRFDYHEELHLELIRDHDGVALERILPGKPTNDPDNWSSASQTENFGTPGYENSQFASKATSEGELTVTPEIFSPDNDGYHDNLQVSYKLSESGYLGTITIYDANGRTVKKLVNNHALGIEGTYTWDGVTEDNLKAPIGIYIVVLELYNLEGETQTIRKTCVLGGKL